MQRENRLKKRNVMETKKRTPPKMNLLSAVEQVVELSKGSRLNDEFYKKAARPLKHLADNLELSKEQCVMMAAEFKSQTQLFGLDLGSIREQS